MTLAIPVARLADRRSRRKVIALAVTFWSVMTMFCGLADATYRSEITAADVCNKAL